MATVLFINRTDLVRNSIMDGNVDTDKFIQFIKLAQEIHIQNYLGAQMYDGLTAALAMAECTSTVLKTLKVCQKMKLITSLKRRERMQNGIHEGSLTICLSMRHYFLNIHPTAMMTSTHHMMQHSMDGFCE